jgi:VanZ family protein
MPLQLKSFIPAFIWTMVVLGLSAMPGTFIPSFSWSDLVSLDKLAHAIVYCILTLLIFAGFRAQQPNHPVTFRVILIAVGFSCCWGAAMEWMQGTFFPQRAFELLDMLANCAGAFIGWGLSPLMYSYIQKKRMQE